jgi:hypothetical protein
MIFKIFSPKKSAKKLAFLTRNKANLCKILIITFVFEKNANFFAENWKKSQKIAIITLTPESQCDDFKKFSPKKIATNLAYKILPNHSQNMNITSVLKGKRRFFRQK